MLQNKGYRVALVTDGRMSGASGSVPAAIHLYPGAHEAGPISRIQNGDVIILDAAKGSLEIKVDQPEFAARKPGQRTEQPGPGFGLELFAPFRATVSDPESGATIFPGWAGATGR